MISNFITFPFYKASDKMPYKKEMFYGIIL